MVANELGIGWVSVWVSVWALQIYDAAILVCDNNLDLMCLHGFWGYLCFFSFFSPLYRFTMVLACETSLGTAHYITKRRGVVFFSPHVFGRRFPEHPTISYRVDVSQLRNANYRSQGGQDHQAVQRLFVVIDLGRSLPFQRLKEEGKLILQIL